MTLLDKDEKDDFFMLMRTNDSESFDSKYDKIMSHTIRRKSRRKMMGSMMGSKSNSKNVGKGKVNERTLHLATFTLILY